MRFFTFSIILLCTIVSTKAQKVSPEVDNHIYSLSFNNVVFKVDAMAGAKIPSLQINDKEFLVSEEVSPGFLWGATVWPAPQSEFNWPPPMLLDDGDYTAVVADDIMTFTSPIDTDANNNEMQIVKSFYADKADTSINIQYTLINKGNNDITKAIWELTRPPVNGLTFWPTGSGVVWGDLASFTAEQQNHTWLDINIINTSGIKLFANGSQGWLAHVDADNRLYIKTFDDVDPKDFADGEAEIEIWIANDYIELETIGAAKTIKPNESIQYNSKWYIREIPENINVEVASSSLIAYVNSVIKNTGTSIKQTNQLLSHCSYPNPVKNSLTFALGDAISENAMLTVFDVTGKLQYKATIQNQVPIDLNNLKSGVYLYNISFDQKIEQGRFIKE